MEFSETRAIEEAVLINESAELKRILAGQKGTSIVSNLNELIKVLPVMGITTLQKKKKG